MYSGGTFLCQRSIPKPATKKKHATSFFLYAITLTLTLGHEGLLAVPLGPNLDVFAAVEDSLQSMELGVDLDLLTENLEIIVAVRHTGIAILDCPKKVCPRSPASVCPRKPSDTLEGCSPVGL